MQTITLLNLASPITARVFHQTGRTKKGSGLDIMQFRARLIGATLDIQHFDNGTRIVCKIPASESSYSLDSAGAETS